MRQVSSPWGLLPDGWKLSTIKKEMIVVTDYVANGSFASLAENVQYSNTEEYAILIRLYDYNNNFSGNFVYVNEHAYNFLSKSKLYGDEIIISNVGANVGTVFKCPRLSKPMTLGPNSIVVKLNGNNDFYFYWFKSRYGKYCLDSIVSGSAQPKFNKTHFKEMPIPVPPLVEQEKIASILSALDNKIAVNRRICANLEAQAEALFKSWFVDFTPFKDQPFVDSELGPIPQGWKVGKADDFYKINIGKTPPRKEKEWFSKNESDNKWISISDMGNCGLFISNSAEKLTNAAIKKFNISLVPVNTILLSFKLTIGRVAISDCDLTTNEAIARFILPDECYLEFSFLMLKLYNYSTLGSTSSIATAVNSKIIKSMKIVMPSQKVLEDFHTITNPLFEKIRFTQKENQRLAALRDTLLPKLMSGEIKL